MIILSFYYNKKNESSFITYMLVNWTQTYLYSNQIVLFDFES